MTSLLSVKKIPVTLPPMNAAETLGVATAGFFTTIAFVCREIGGAESHCYSSGRCSASVSARSEKGRLVRRMGPLCAKDRRGCQLRQLDHLCNRTVKFKSAGRHFGEEANHRRLCRLHLHRAFGKSLDRLAGAALISSRRRAMSPESCITKSGRTKTKPTRAYADDASPPRSSRFGVICRHSQQRRAVSGSSRRSRQCRRLLEQRAVPSRNGQPQPRFDTGHVVPTARKPAAVQDTPETPGNRAGRHAMLSRRLPAVQRPLGRQKPDCASLGITSNTVIKMRRTRIFSTISPRATMDE